MEANKAISEVIKVLFGEEKIRSFEGKLFLNKSKFKNINSFLGFCVIEGIILMTILMIIGVLIFKRGLDFSILIGTAGFFIPLTVNYFFHDLLFEKRKRQREELLPEVLLEASLFCDETSAERTIKKISEQDFLYISSDFKLAIKEINNGGSVEGALERIKLLNKSKPYSRVIDLIIQGYKSGAKMSEMMKETVEDLLESKAIISEKQAVMLVSKYTLLASAGLIVPAILGLIIGLVLGLNFESIGELSLGLSASERKNLFETAVLATTIYVFEYATLAAFFLALQEGNKKNSIIFGLILIPVAGIVFFTATRMLF
ncbi:MAG: type II secretion system F family protein [Candidatus Diapherotrites archaeon]|nr:type II secretion system F family protein [Candidatus Diapherotrites archaeon]